MSSKANAARYSQSSGAGTGSLDLFGIRERRANRMADSDMERQLKLQKLLQELQDESERTGDLRKSVLKREEDESGSKARTQEASDKADIEIAKAMGVFQKYRDKLSPQQAALIEGLNKKEQLQTDAFNAPEMGDVVKRNIQASMLAPEFANTKAGTMSAGPGELVAAPSGPGVFNGFRPYQMTGALGGGSQVTETSRSFNGMALPPDVKMTTSPMIAPTFKQPVNPGGQRLNIVQKPNGNQAPAPATGVDQTGLKTSFEDGDYGDETGLTPEKLRMILMGLGGR